MKHLLTARVFSFISILSLFFSALGAPMQSAWAAPSLAPAAEAADCQNPPNEIVAENCMTGNPPSEWDVSGAGDLSIQGFATDISVNRGETVHFKIDTDATAYHIDIYRLGYYGGDGARRVATITPSATLPQIQPACLFDPTDDWNLTDCGNWGDSASWAVPSTAVSGIYIARPSRDDAGHLGEASHIVFIVRDDASHSDILLQTSDTTWQAYNRYGGYSLYDGGGGANDGAHAHKVSYNRPFTTRAAPTEDWLFNAEYPMLRFLERNGYDVTYSTDLDSDRRGDLILNHKIFISSGHDEYWSAVQRMPVSRRLATQASTWPSSAATRATGRPVGNQAQPMVEAPRTAPWSATRKAMPRAASTTTVLATSTATRTRRFGPASGVRTRLATMAGDPRTR